MTFPRPEFKNGCMQKKRERKKRKKKKAPFIGFYTFSCRLKKRHFTHFFFNLHFSSPALGSDEDYHVDIIHELDLANATYGITQVAGLHNGSKAFIFRGNAYTLTLSSSVVKFRLSLFSRLHRRTHTAFIHTDTHTHQHSHSLFYYRSCVWAQPRSATPPWSHSITCAPESNHPRLPPLVITPHLICHVQQMPSCLLITVFNNIWCQATLTTVSNWWEVWRCRFLQSLKTLVTKWLSSDKAVVTLMWGTHLTW